LNQFASQGQLNSPWGMAWAPFEGFGKFNNALLVGNFGDGSINAFDFDSGEFFGTLGDSSGKAINIPGICATVRPRCCEYNFQQFILHGWYW